MKFSNSEGLEIDFDPTANLEVEIRQGSWCSTSPEMFRSWSGPRRVDGQEYEGPTYVFLSNQKSEDAASEILSTSSGPLSDKIF